jgi:hypothetical protein
MQHHHRSSDVQAMVMSNGSHSAHGSLVREPK